MEILLDESWLSRKYLALDAEINTAFSYVSVGKDYFFQGSEADAIIKEIHNIWISGELTDIEAFQKWINSNLY